jgi:ankyrin repeat protein
MWSEFLLEEQLVEAAANGNMTTVRLLVNIGVDIDCKTVEWGDTPLAAADRYGHKDVVTYLLDHHADTKGISY